jgi:phosphoribosyl 1,2-cyclic phosphate phosphodiesterase
MGGGKPRLALHEVEPAFELCGLRVESFYVMHGKLPVLSYRFTDPTTGRSAAYVTDVSSIPPDAMERLRGLDLLLLDAVRYEPHPTHFGLYQALDVIGELKPARALLTHLSHHFDHATANTETPDHVELSYDGQRIVV